MGTEIFSPLLNPVDEKAAEKANIAKNTLKITVNFV